jgi:hypothetical protein
MERQARWRQVSELLHDARLRHLEWDPALGRLSLEFECLRREVDGSELPDPAVAFRLDGVRAIVAGYESGLFGVRPSAYRPQRLLEEDDLRSWPFNPAEAYLSVNSHACREDVLEAPLTRWLAGDRDALDGCDFRVGLTFDHTPMLGIPTNTVRLLIGCENIEIWSGAVPLDLETWGEQYAAWWASWRKYWEEKQDGEGEGEGRLEDTIIPAGEPEPPDLSYQPPREPPVRWEPTDAPAELLRPITDWFEAKHQRDWSRLARAYPNRDRTPEQRAEQLAGWAEHDFGRWGYARQVDDWWVEGVHAEVTVRGVEHVMPDGEDPGSNTESVWTVRLRRQGDGWVIRTWCQGWPPHGSAPARPTAEKPWLHRWSSGPVICSRTEEN